MLKQIREWVGLNESQKELRNQLKAIEEEIEQAKVDAEEANTEASKFTAQRNLHEANLQLDRKADLRNKIQDLTKVRDELRAKVSQGPDTELRHLGPTVENLLDDDQEEEQPIASSSTPAVDSRTSTGTPLFGWFRGWGGSKEQEAPGAGQHKRIAELERSLETAEKNVAKAKKKYTDLLKEKKPLAAGQARTLFRGYQQQASNLRNALDKVKRDDSLASRDHRSNPPTVDKPFDFGEESGEKESNVGSRRPPSSPPSPSRKGRRVEESEKESDSEREDDSEETLRSRHAPFDSFDYDDFDEWGEAGASSSGDDSAKSPPSRRNDISYSEVPLRSNEGKIEYRQTKSGFLEQAKSEVILRGAPVTTSPNKQSNLHQAVDVVASKNDFKDVLFIKGSVENIKETLQALKVKNPDYNGKIFVQSPGDQKAILLSTNNAEFKAFFKQQPPPPDDEPSGRSLGK